MNFTVKTLVLAGVYCATGWIAMRRGGPEGYPTAIFLPAGIALAALLTHGNRLWPGVWLGDFLLGVLDAYTGGGAVSGAVFWLRACVALGASLQALLGVALARRWVRHPQTLDGEADIVRFLLLAGPFACLVNASVAVASLLAAGDLDGLEALLAWWAWWIGDVLGVLIGAPLALCFLGSPREPWRARRLTVALPLVLALAALTVFFQQAGSWESQRFRIEFEQRSSALAEALKRRLAGDLNLLDALARFMESAPVVSREQFYDFLKQVLRRHPGIQALEWTPRVPAVNRPSFESAMRLHGFPGFRITERAADGRMIPAGPRGEYFPVTFIEPFLPNGQALGFDLASEAARREALERARAAAAPAATGPIVLVQETKGGVGLIVVQPVYARSLLLEDRESPPRALQGYALAVFRVADLVETVYRAADRADVSLEILDETAPAGSRLLYGSGAIQPEHRPAEIERSTRIELAGRRWTLRSTPTRRYLSAYRSFGAWTSSAASPLLTGLLAAFLLATSGRARRVEALVAQRTLELRKANRSLHASEARFRTLADTVPALIWLADPQGNRKYFNRGWLEFTGRTLDQEFGYGWTEQIHPKDRDACLRTCTEAVRTASAFEIEYRVKRRDGAYRWILDRGGPHSIPDQAFAGFIGTAFDITERKEQESEVRHLAYHDALTGLPNRRLFMDRLKQALAQAERRHHALAVLFADLDDFKTVNDSLGHAAGDELLQLAVARLNECLREEDTVARVGGDEFLLVLPNLPSGVSALPVAQKALAVLAQPFVVAEREVRVTVSLGISVYPRDGADPETLVHRADAALYRAKEAGRNAYRFFSLEG